MKKFITSVVAVAAVAADVQAPNVKIAEFTAVREPATVGGPDSIFLSGKLKNTGTKVIDQVEYGFTQWDGKSWVGVKGGFRASGPAKSLKPGDVVPVSIWVPNSDSEQQFGLSVTERVGGKAGGFGSVGLTLAAKPKKPTLTLLEWKRITRVTTGGAVPFDAGECRVYVSGEPYAFDTVTGPFNFSSRPRLLGDRPVIVQFWRINGLKSDEKLGEQRIVSTEKSGEYTITFSGKSDGDAYKYQVKYRIDR